MRKIKDYAFRKALIVLASGSDNLLPIGVNRLVEAIERIGGACLTDVMHMYTVRDNFKGFISRYDIHDNTEMGSLRSVNEINFIASQLPLWDSLNHKI